MVGARGKGFVAGPQSWLGLGKVKFGWLNLALIGLLISFAHPTHSCPKAASSWVWVLVTVV